MTTTTRLAPGTVNPGAAGHDAQLALQAFLPRVALLDSTLQIVRWCSPGFSALAGLEAGDPMSEVWVRVPGARGAFDGLASAALPTPRWGPRVIRVGVGLVALAVDDPAPDPAHPPAHPPAHEIDQPLGAVVNVLQGLRAQLMASAQATLPEAPVMAVAPLPCTDEVGTAQRAWANRLATLTPREREVHQWVIQDRLNKTISGLLGISIKTVELHRANLMRKLGARSLTHLVKMTVSGCVS